jgi:hypothetical protein
MITIPEAPKPGATEAERQAFDDACRVADLALRAEALRQQDDAKTHRDRMAAATEANGAALRAVADKTEVPPDMAKKRAEMVFLVLAHQARGSKTPAARVADVVAQVNAAFAALTSTNAAGV